MSVAKIFQCFEKTSENQQITTVESWKVFTSLLAKFHLFSDEDLEKINRFCPSFPVSFECVLATFAQISTNEDTRKLIELLLNLHTFLIQTRDSIETWNPLTLSQCELSHLLYKLYSCYSKVLKSDELLQDLAAKLNTYSEDSQSLVYDKVYDKSKTVVTSHSYQEEEMESIEKAWNKERVRAVQYRNRPVKVLKNHSNGVVKQLGFCARRDTPVEVWKVPKQFFDFEWVTNFFNIISAHKQLFFSKYFHCYLGFDEVTDENYNLYFFEVLRGMSVKRLFGEKLLHKSPSLLRHWSRELLYAFADLLHKCTHTVNCPITVENVFSQDNGIKVYLKGVDFGEVRPEETHKATEAKLLSMYGSILLELTTGSSSFRNFAELDIDLELRAIIEECLKERTTEEISEVETEGTLQELELETSRIQQGHFSSPHKRKRFKQKQILPRTYIEDQLTFMRLMTHPYLAYDNEFEDKLFDSILEEYDVLIS